MVGERRKIQLPNGPKVREIESDLKNADYLVTSVKTKERRRRPSPPFTTSTLQQEAGRKLRFTAKRTMRVAQQLYEGISLGSEGPAGLITYMRTDSTSLASSAIGEARKYISEKYGDRYLPKGARIYKTRSKGAQEAHEAIRPTSIFRTPESLKRLLKPEQFRLYTLIWQRTLASQMADTIYDATSADIRAARPDADKAYLFRATGTRTKFLGFATLYKEGKDDDPQDDGKPLPKLEKDDALDFKKLESKQHFTQPPPRYTEATLVKLLEEKGIGRPSTYAPILGTLTDRNYVTKEKNRLTPTALGISVSDLLTQFFPDVMDVAFTANMEDSLDEIARGERQWVPMLENFYTPFKKTLEEARTKMPRVKVEEPTNEVCEKCERPMVIKTGRFGRFMACSGFPECRNTREIGSNGAAPAQEETTDGNMRKVRQPHGHQDRSIRPLHGLLQLSQVPQHQAHEDRSPLPQVRRRRPSRTERTPRRLLRLLQLPRVPVPRQQAPPTPNPAPSARASWSSIETTSTPAHAVPGRANPHKPPLRYRRRCPSPRNSLDRYKAFLTGTKGRSENTVRVYLDDLSTFDRFLKLQDAKYARLDRRFLRQYLAWLATKARGKRGGYARVSVARKLVSLRAFYRFLQQQGVVKINPVPKGSAFRVKTEKRLPDFLTENETERILEAPDTDTELGIRDQAILELLYSSGVRLSELAALNMEDLNLETREAKVWGKGSKERIVLLGGPAVQSLHHYLSASRPLLQGQLHQRPLPQQVRRPPLPPQHPENRQEKRPPGHHQPQDPHPQHAPHLRHPHAGRRRRPPRRPGTPRPLQPRHHPDIHPRYPAPGKKGLHGQPSQGQRQPPAGGDAMRTFLVVNGPNLNMLGRRDPEKYGSMTLTELEEMLTRHADNLDLEVEFCQSNSESELVDFINGNAHRADGIIINPAGLTTIGYPLLDACIDSGIPRRGSPPHQHLRS